MAGQNPKKEKKKQEKGKSFWSIFSGEEKIKTTL